MRLLLIHADFLEFEAKEKTKVAEEVPEEEKSGRSEEALVAFIAIEEEDEEDPESIIENTFDEVNQVREKVGAESVVIYPYAHLSESLSSPDTAIQVMDSICDKFEEIGVEYLRAPFGWYKSFDLKCKGHPLSELSRTIGPEEVEEEEVEEIPSRWKIIDEDGGVHDLSEFDGGERLQKVIQHEIKGVEGEGEEPPHVRLMREKELVGYDELSDPGNLRWYPRGKLVRDLIIDYVNKRTTDYGAVNVETPIMYDLGDEAISGHSEKFGERQYRLESGNRKMVLRFAACFGMFSMMRDMFLSVEDLPLKMYELSTYSFRREQRGEIVGLKRLRAFTMPDMHTACEDLEGAREEFGRQVKWTLETEGDLNIDYQVILRVTEDFYEENEEWIRSFVRETGRPTLVEIIEERKHYWVAKCDLAALDASGKPLENPTVQIDVESAERFGISYHDDEREGKPPILHTSPTGSIERVICAILEDVANDDKPQFPLWLSPTQVRLIPVGEEHVDSCSEIAEELSESGIRVDIDDRDRTIGKRIRRAEKDWVPYTIVFGDREKDSDEVPVRDRKSEEERDMTIEELRGEINERTEGKPFKQLSLPRKISERPNFLG